MWRGVHGEGYVPKDEVGVGHEVGNALQHTPRLQNKGGESDLGEVHANSRGERDDVQYEIISYDGMRRHLSCEISDEIMDPSFSSLHSESSWSVSWRE